MIQQGAVDNIMGKANCITLLIVGVILIMFIDLFILRIVYSLRINEMETLVSFAFFIPPDIYNRIEPYKSFNEEFLGTLPSSIGDLHKLKSL
ncbi:hypothetical protein U3516DRAFT_764796 [Neocallimastix sp. 'constans']